MGRAKAFLALGLCAALALSGPAGAGGKGREPGRGEEMEEGEKKGQDRREQKEPAFCYEVFPLEGKCLAV